MFNTTMIIAHVQYKHQGTLATKNSSWNYVEYYKTRNEEKVNPTAYNIFFQTKTTHKI